MLMKVYSTIFRNTFLFAAAIVDWTSVFMNERSFAHNDAMESPSNTSASVSSTDLEVSDCFGVYALFPIQTTKLPVGLVVISPSPARLLLLCAPLLAFVWNNAIVTWRRCSVLRLMLRVDNLRGGWASRPRDRNNIVVHDVENSSFGRNFGVVGGIRELHFSW